MVDCEQWISVESEINNEMIDDFGGSFVNKKGNLEQRDLGFRNPNDIYFGGAFLPGQQQPNQLQRTTTGSFVQCTERGFEIIGLYKGRETQKQGQTMFNVYVSISLFYFCCFFFLFHCVFFFLGTNT